MLIKVRAPPGSDRGEINDLVRIFRGRIVDVGEGTFTIAVTGDPGKVRNSLIFYFMRKKERKGITRGFSFLLLPRLLLKISPINSDIFLTSLYRWFRSKKRLVDSESSNLPGQAALQLNEANNYSMKLNQGGLGVWLGPP